VRDRLASGRLPLVLLTTAPETSEIRRSCDTSARPRLARFSGVT
jgi:hypothetical protein